VGVGADDFALLFVFYEWRRMAMFPLVMSEVLLGVIVELCIVSYVE